MARSALIGQLHTPIDRAPWALTGGFAKSSQFSRNSLAPACQRSARLKPHCVPLHAGAGRAFYHREPDIQGVRSMERRGDHIGARQGAPIVVGIPERDERNRSGGGGHSTDAKAAVRGCCGSKASRRQSFVYGRRDCSRLTASASAVERISGHFFLAALLCQQPLANQSSVRGVVYPNHSDLLIPERPRVNGALCSLSAPVQAPSLCEHSHTGKSDGLSLTP